MSRLVCSSCGVPKITEDDLREAIAEGVYRAFWQMITNATDAPCADFYDAVERGVEKAMREAESSKAADQSAREEF